MDSTIIRRGVKLDNLVQIAHNVEVGENTVMAAQVGIAGSVKVGKHCMFGGQVGLAGHIHVADHVVFGAQAGVISDVKEATTLLGAPAIDAKKLHAFQRDLQPSSGYIPLAGANATGNRTTQERN